MPDFASNTPISRPILMSEWKADWDVGGMLWSHDFGMFYQGTSNEDLLPFRLPGPITGGR